MRINADDIVSQLVEEHGLQEAYRVALNDAAEALRAEDNYLLSVLREVKVILRRDIAKKFNAKETSGS